MAFNKETWKKTMPYGQYILPIAAPTNKQILQLFRNVGTIYNSYDEARNAVLARVHLSGLGNKPLTYSKFIVDHQLQDGEPFAIRYRENEDIIYGGPSYYDKYETRETESAGGGVTFVYDEHGKEIKTGSGDDTRITMGQPDLHIYETGQGKKVFRVRTMFCIAYNKWDGVYKSIDEVSDAVASGNTDISNYDMHIDIFDNADEAYRKYFQNVTGQAALKAKTNGGTIVKGGDDISTVVTRDGKNFKVATEIRVGQPKYDTNTQTDGIVTTKTLSTLLDELKDNTAATPVEGQYISAIKQNRGRIEGIKFGTIPAATVTAVNDTITPNTVTVGLSLSDKKVTPVNKTISVNSIPFNSDDSNNLSASITGDNVPVSGESSLNDSDVSKVVAGDKINVAIAKLQNQITAVDGKSGVTSVKATGDSHITVTPTGATTGPVTLTAKLNVGTLAETLKGETYEFATRKNITDLKGNTSTLTLTGYDASTSGAISASDTISTGISKLQYQIDQLPDTLVSSVITTNTTYITMTPTTAKSGAVTVNATLKLADVATDLVKSHKIATTTYVTGEIKNINGNTLVLTGYNASTSGAISATDSISVGVSKLQKQISDIKDNYVSSVNASGDTYVTLTANPTKDAVKITASTKTGSGGLATYEQLDTRVKDINGSNILLDGYTANKQGEISAESSVNDAISILGRKFETIHDAAIDEITIKNNAPSLLSIAPTTINKQNHQLTFGLTLADTSSINENAGRLVLTGNALDGLVDNKFVQVVYNNLVPEKLKVGSDFETQKNDGEVKGDIKITDTVNQALAKLNKGINDVSSAAKTYKIQEVSNPPSKVYKRYELFENNASMGSRSSYIDIPYDSSLKEVHLGKDSATIDPDGTYHEGTSGKDSLNFVYFLSDGTYKIVHIDVSNFLRESEFKDGLQVSSNGEVSVKTLDKNPVKINPTGAGKEVIYEIAEMTKTISTGTQTIGSIKQNTNGTIVVTPTDHTYATSGGVTETIKTEISNHVIKSNLKIHDESLRVENETDSSHPQGVMVWKIDCGTF